jgi:Sortase domain
MKRTAALVLWSTVVAAGCTGAAAVLVGFTGSTSAVRDIDPGAPTRLASSAPTAPAPPSSATSTAPITGPPASATTRPPASAATRPSQADRALPPVGIRIASIGIVAPVKPVGVDSRGDVVVPERVDTVGWYRYSALPGSAAGSTVLVGHVDSAQRDEGVFFRLRDVGRGDRVVVDLAGGGRLSYQVISRARFPKAAAPLADLFSLDGRPRLTLITCGGAFDAAAGHYRDNIVITAVPL